MRKERVMNEYTFEFHNVNEALVFVKTLQATLDLKEFSIVGMERARDDILRATERWNVKVWIKTSMGMRDIRDTCKILRFYNGIDFGGANDATE
jgi:hypothetical protein